MSRSRCRLVASKLARRGARGGANVAEYSVDYLKRLKTAVEAFEGAFEA